MGFIIKSALNNAEHTPGFSFLCIVKYAILVVKENWRIAGSPIKEALMLDGALYGIVMISRNVAQLFNVIFFFY